MSARGPQTDTHGVLLLDKPAGITSNTALQRARRLYGKPKAGHTGTLDPLASGLLPICFGEATKFSQYLLNSEKSYETMVILGWRSSTGDAEGELVRGEHPGFSDAELSQAMASLTGEIDQIPPMYSAIKFAGTPLYKLARKGMNVTRKARKANVRELRLINQTADTLQMSVVCSKGTYIRVVAEDLGNRLGCGAYLGSLRRTGVGGFSVSEAIRIEELDVLTPVQRLALLKPVETLVADLPKILLDPDEARHLQHGLVVSGKAGVPDAGLFRIYDSAGCFLGVAEAKPGGLVRSKRLLSQRFRKTVNP